MVLGTSFIKVRRLGLYKELVIHYLADFPLVEIKFVKHNLRVMQHNHYYNC